MSFPVDRPRRLRTSSTIRRLVRETRLSVDDLVQPLFVVPGKDIKKEISSMPGQYHYSVNTIIEEVEIIARRGIPAIILFGIPENKDEEGSQAWAENGIVQQAIKQIKQKTPDLLVIADVCLCEYTSHGHCGVVQNGTVMNDPTLKLLSRTAVSLAHAGADIIAPSDMMDGRIGSIRTGLDEAGFKDKAILSYAVKYSSSYYGPFREAADSAPQFGNRRGYQMDPGNANEALREVQLDLEEGADMVMVKPGVSYLDILWRVKERFGRVTGAYQVSGEYSMIEAAAANGWIDRKAVILETLLSFKRAGADFILTYFASEVAEWLKGS
ncbi:MAG: porphobilinogen synthase [Candidatus Electryonea clarkiae]|nr:porphobilinogen synthase [Candidatus Electryonea clarkiae]